MEHIFQKDTKTLGKIHYKIETISPPEIIMQCNIFTKRIKSYKIGNFISYSKGDNHFKNCIKSIQDVISCDNTLENNRKKDGQKTSCFST